MNLGIDATNIRAGGGITHLAELLSAFNFKDSPIKKIYVFSGHETLKMLPSSEFIEKVSHKKLNKGLISRSLWQLFSLSKAAKKRKCDILFIPGGNYWGWFHPVVTLSQNMLPFELGELKRYGLSKMLLKLLLLRIFQSISFMRSDGVIFLTDFARVKISKIIGKNVNQSEIVPHGINPCFYNLPKPQKSIDSYNAFNRFKLTYVSTVDVYKHQLVLITAVSDLIKEGLPLSLEIVGSGYKPELTKMINLMNKLDPGSIWLKYRGKVPFYQLPKLYKEADMGVFSSTCENLPNILLEKMASGLPIACSNYGAMSEVLGSSGIYFSPTSLEETKNILRKMISSPEMRNKSAHQNYKIAKKYSWNECATKTFNFISFVKNNYVQR